MVQRKTSPKTHNNEPQLDIYSSIISYFFYYCKFYKTSHYSKANSLPPIVGHLPLANCSKVLFSLPNLIL